MAHPEPISAMTPDGAHQRTQPLLISVDDVGQFVAVMSRSLILGHCSDGQADLPFLADVGARHGQLTRRDSLRDGTVWSLAPLGEERISINGERLMEGRGLISGDLIRLSDNLALDFSSPDPASQSALLSLGRAQECLGAQRIVLMAEGEGGRLRIGSGAQRLIRVPNLEQQLSIEWYAERLSIRCSEPLLSWAGGQNQSQVDLSLPMREQHQLCLGQSRAGRPPFGLGIGPPSAKDLARGGRPG